MREISEEEVGPAIRVGTRVTCDLNVDLAARVGTTPEQNSTSLVAIGGLAGEVLDAAPCLVLDLYPVVRLLPHVGQSARGDGSSPHRTSPASSMSNGGAMPVFGRRARIA